MVGVKVRVKSDLTVLVKSFQKTAHLSEGYLQVQRHHSGSKWWWLLECEGVSQALTELWLLLQLLQITNHGSGYIIKHHSYIPVYILYSNLFLFSRLKISKPVEEANHRQRWGAVQSWTTSFLDLQLLEKSYVLNNNHSKDKSDCYLLHVQESDVGPSKHQLWTQLL